MIYVTVGGHPQGFDRLIKRIDSIAPELGEKVVIQKGVSKYKPANAEYFDYVEFMKGEEYIKNANLVISHAGMGTLIMSLKHKVPVIIVPRIKKYGEHINDHQSEICTELKKVPRQGVYVVSEPEEITAGMIGDAVRMKGAAGVESESRERLVEEVTGFIEHRKVLMVNPMDITYGSTHRIRQFYVHLKALGWDIDYVESNYKGAWKAVSVWQANNIFGFLIGNIQRLLISLFWKYDILFTQTITPLTVSMMFAAKLRGKKVVVDWDDLSWALQKTKLRSFLVKFCEHTFIKLPDMVFVPNRYLLVYGKKYGAKDIRFVPHGVDYEIFDPSLYDMAKTRLKLGIDEKKTVLGFLASFTTGGVGDLDFVYETVKDMISKNPDIYFLIIGGGPLFAEYKALAAKTGINNLVFTGLIEQKEVPEYINSIDIAIIFMRDNIKNTMKTSLKAGEYLAMNKIVVGHLVGQTKDDFGQYCMLCEPTRESFAKKIEESIKISERRSWARDYMIEHYRWSVSAGLIDNFMREEFI